MAEKFFLLMTGFMSELKSIVFYFCYQIKTRKNNTT